MGRIANKLARHYEHRLSNRFEYVTVSPRPKELLVILGDGTAVLVPRPLDQADDETDVLSISLSEESSTATLALASGKKITLDVRSIADSRSQKAFAAYANGIEKYEAQYGAILAARLKSLRQAAGLTQAELARRTGIHRPNIARVEAGRHTPSLETLTRLAAAIGVTPTSLFLDE
ncbi:MAG: helix-turn-helix transcriptional regulator [Deltaproteobacteria bacterium]|nr:helix-turn-helix transcriptional regulator [Deltaproteobacteria bacterium]